MGLASGAGGAAGLAKAISCTLSVSPRAGGDRAALDGLVDAELRRRARLAVVRVAPGARDRVAVRGVAGHAGLAAGRDARTPEGLRLARLLERRALVGV